MISIQNPTEFDSKSLPAEPGVYIYKNDKEEIIYVGKAKNLKSRVRSYFSNPNSSIKTAQLVSKIRHIDWIIVDSEVEALLLENKLIKKHTPKYNISLKDSKTFAYIAFTLEKFPRILSSRKTSSKLDSYGPYTDGGMRLELQKMIVKVFKIRTCRKMPKRACLNYHIGICTAPCILNVNEEEYNNQVKLAKSFLNGDIKPTLEKLNKDMQDFSKQQKFERAIEIKNQIESIKLLTEKQIVDREKRFDQDILVLKKSGNYLLALSMGVRKGVLLGKKEFKLDYQENIEQEFLKAFYVANEIPKEILLNNECWQNEEERLILEEFLSKTRGTNVRLFVPQRGESLNLVKLAEKNLEFNLEGNSGLIELQTNLKLQSIPKIIECFDISNLGKEHIVCGMTRFVDGKPDKKGYRRFKIKTFEGQDDFASMHEAVYRRYKRLKEENLQMPSLIVIDGGLGQIRAATTALDELGLTLPLIGLAKKLEEIYRRDSTEPLRFDNNSKMMLLLRKIRDATHNFAIGYNKKLREIKMKEEFKEVK